MLLRFEIGLAKVAILFTASGSKSKEAVFVAEGVYDFQTMKHHSTMKCSWVDSHVKM
jgi:hypothetical protein